MTVKECYEKAGADYKDVLQRFGSENLVQKFALKFLDDPSFGTLQTALENGESETAFLAVHTLKGVCANLGLNSLYQVSAELTEFLRGGIQAGYAEKFQKVEQEYSRTIHALAEIGK